MSILTSLYSCAQAAWGTYADGCLLSGNEAASGSHPQPPSSPLSSSATVISPLWLSPTTDFAVAIAVQNSRILIAEFRNHGHEDRAIWASNQIVRFHSFLTPLLRIPRYRNENEPLWLEDRAAPRHQHCVWRRRAGTRRIGYASPFGHLGRAAPPPAHGGGGWHPFSWPVSSALFGSLRVVRCLTESPQSIANSMFHNARQGSSFFWFCIPHRLLSHTL